MTKHLPERTPEPPIDEALLDYLKECFPDRCPTLGHTDREIWVAVGAVKVIRHLQAVYDGQNEN